MFSNEKKSVSENSIPHVQDRLKRVNPSTAIGGKGDTLLHTALAQERLSEDDFEKVHGFLGENTMLLTERNGDGNTPIHIAAEFIHSDVIATALSQIDLYPVIGAVRIVNVIEQNKQGKNPLHLAVENKHLIDSKERHIKSVRVIIEHLGELINVKDNEGRTPLHIAILSIKDLKNPSKSISCYDIVEEFLNIPNIDTEVTDNEGKSVYDYVLECTDKELIVLFIQHYSEKKAAAKSKFESSGKAAKNKEHLSKTCNLSTVGLGGAGGVFTLGHEYHDLVLFTKKLASLLKALGVVTSSCSGILLPIALYFHYQSSRCEKEHDLLSEDIEECKIKIAELHNILKDIEHNKAIAKLEKSLEENKKELRELSDPDIKSILDRESCIVLTNIERSYDEHRRVSCISQIMQHTFNKKNSEVPTFTIPEITYSESSEGPSSTYVSVTHIASVPASANVEENIEDESDFRPRAKSCGAHFNGRPSTILRLPKLSSVKDISCGRS